MKDAYLVLFINRRTNAIASAGIYSEPEPTCAGDWRPEVIWHRQAETYALARDEIRECLRQALAQGAPAVSDVRDHLRSIATSPVNANIDRNVVRLRPQRRPVRR